MPQTGLPYAHAASFRGKTMSEAPLLAPVRAQSLVDMIAAQLEEAILNGQLAPGTKISEQGLARTLRVSRGPLREAIRRLEGRKLIERTPNIGARVAKLTDRGVQDVLVIREALEGMASRYAAICMSDEEIEALGNLLDEQGVDWQKTGTGYFQKSKDFDFHIRVARGSRNQRLIDMLCGDLYDLLRVYRYKSNNRAGRPEEAFNEHRRIVAAIAARDPDLAETAMREHIRNSRASLEKDFGSGFVGLPIA